MTSTPTDRPPLDPRKDHRRVFGLETEYGVLYDPPATAGNNHDNSHDAAAASPSNCPEADQGRPTADPADRRSGPGERWRSGRAIRPEDIDAEAAATRIFAPLVAAGRSANAFLANGARMYLDVGAHPEYATAECSRIGELVANDRAGDELFAELTEHANRALQCEKIGGTIHLIRNNIDTSGASYGCHENYLVHRSREFRARLDALLPFLVSRQLLTGAGRVVNNEGRASFHLSQRAEIMTDAISAATTRSRPMINTRDEPHADVNLYRRMHVIVGDSNMCEATTAAKVGTTHAVLSAMEIKPWAFTDLELEDPAAAIQEISKDITGTAVVTLRDGRKLSGTELQREFFTRTTALLPAKVLDDPLMGYVMDLWERTIVAFESGDFSSVETELDWRIKYRLVSRYLDRAHGQDFDARISRLEIAFHDLSPTTGLRPALEARGLMKRLSTAEQVERARSVPPQTTRAKARGKFIAAAQKMRRDISVNWAVVRLADCSGRGPTTVHLADPFAPENARIDELISQMGESDPLLPA